MIKGVFEQHKKGCEVNDGDVEGKVSEEEMEGGLVQSLV